MVRVDKFNDMLQQSSKYHGLGELEQIYNHDMPHTVYFRVKFPLGDMPTAGSALCAINKVFSGIRESDYVNDIKANYEERIKVLEAENSALQQYKVFYDLYRELKK